MESVLRTHRSAPILGLMFAMPLAIILIVEISGVQPFRDLFVSLTTEGGVEPRLSTVGKAVTLGALLLLPVGLTISLVPIVRSPTGKGVGPAPFNLLVSAILLIFLAFIVAAFVIDQYPCWMGVPNCD